MHEHHRIVFREYGTELRAETDGSLVLDVLCGSVGQFGVEFALNTDERSEYQRRGDVFIRELSQTVRLDWEAFVARGRAH